MEFKKVKERLTKHFTEALRNGHLFEVDMDKDKLWDIYLNSFPEGTNPIYRERRVYDCSCCRHFLKTIGGTVFVDGDLNIHTLFEFDTDSAVFQPVMDAMDAYVRSKSITDVFLHDQLSIGTDSNKELMPDGSINTYEHFFLRLPNEMVVKRVDIPGLKALYRDRKNVLKRSLDEISTEAVDVVLELISSNTLYKGEEWKHAIKEFKTIKTEYDQIPEDKKDLYTWAKSMEIDDIVGKIRNHSIGVLLVDISNGIELDEAVKRYEKIVAPSNYKRPKAIFTKRMLEEAKQTITDLGYMDSLPRRFATLDDITVNNILFSNKDSAKRITGDIFDDMLSDIPVNTKRFSKVEEIGIDAFISDVLPGVKEMEILLENKLASNMVSLIAPVNKEAPSMFKWNNAYSWAYAGNITDSDIRERVKNAGGNVEGVLRFSIQWNDTGEYSQNDLDAHCIDPRGNRIYFGNMKAGSTGGFLDVDIRYPVHNEPAVENIAWASKSRMIPGKYRFLVHQYANRGGRDGFRAEIEFDGNIHKYDYNKELRQNEFVEVATVILDKDGNFSIEENLKSETASRDIWGLKSNTFVPVSVMMYSPNYWDNQFGVGHRHYFFMLKGCVNPEHPNGFYNEFLKNDLEKHKRVFEALGSKMAVADIEDQLSGIGFSATKRSELVVKVKGATERIMKIKF